MTPGCWDSAQHGRGGADRARAGLQGGGGAVPRLGAGHLRGAPVPVAAYLSTASKLGGVVALLAVTAAALPAGAVGAALPASATGPVLAILAVLTMTVGNLVALRQTRMVRLLAWSSVAQAGYLIAPLGALALGAGRGTEAVGSAVAATVAYTIFFVVLELAAFGAVVALRPAGADGGRDRGVPGRCPTASLGRRRVRARPDRAGRAPAGPGRAVRQGDRRTVTAGRRRRLARRGGRAERGHRARLLPTGRRDALRPARRRGSPRSRLSPGSDRRGR